MLFSACSAALSVKIIHFREAFLPWIPGFSLTGKRALHIRAIRYPWFNSFFAPIHGPEPPVYQPQSRLAALPAKANQGESR
jgi:hypothetical protein